MRDKEVWDESTVREKADVAREASRIVDASKALASHPVAVLQCVGVDVAVAVALAAGSHRSLQAVRVTKVTIRALFTACTISALWTLCADRAVGVAGNLEAGAHPHGTVLGGHLGTGTLLTVVRRAHDGVPVVADSTALAVVTIRVVLALALARLDVAVV